MVNALDDGLDVLQSLLGLGLHAAGDQRARCRVNAELGGDVVVVGERHGLGGQLVLRSAGDVVGLDDQAMTGLNGLRRGAVAVGAHGLDLHERVLRQVGDLDHGASRQVVDGAGDARIREEALVDLVHGLNVAEVLQEDGDLDDVVERNIHGGQDGLDVLQALSGLLLHAAHDDLVGNRVDRQLSGDVVVVGERHRLRGHRVERGVVGVVGVLDQVAGLGLVRDGAFAVGEQSLNLDQGAHGQIVDGNDGAGRHVGGEEGLVGPLHNVDVHDVLDEDGDANDVVQVMIDARNDGCDVAEALLCLLLDTALDDCAGLRIDRQLGREVVVMGESDGLRAHRALRCVLGVPCHYHVIRHGNTLSVDSLQ